MKPVKRIERRHMSPFVWRSVDRFKLHVHFSTQVANHNDFAKMGGFWGQWPPKIELTWIILIGGSYTHGNTAFDVSTKKIGPYLLVDIGFHGEKKGEKLKKAYISPICPDAPSQPIVTKIGRFGGMDEVINRTKFGVDPSTGVGSAGCWKLAFSL